MPTTKPSDYMNQSDTAPGSLEHMFKPLSAEIKADIASVMDALMALAESTPEPHSLNPKFQAFNRLMAELHLMTESATEAKSTIYAFQHDLNAIDKALDAAGMLRGTTVDRVNAIIRLAVNVEAAAPQALAAVRACAQVLSGDGMSKSLLIRALEMCRAVMQRANGEGKGL